MITLSINQLTVQLTIVQRNVNYQTMILPVSYKSSSIICTANDTISSEFPFEQHANPLIISAHDYSLNQSTNSSITIVQRNVNYQTMILLVSYKSSSIICTANDTISSEFPFEQHANPLTIYLRIIELSINQHTVQLTIDQTNINYKQWSCQYPTNQAALYALQITQLVRHFHSNSMQILSQYICP